MTTKQVVIKWITGQERAYLREFLVGKGYDFNCNFRRSSRGGMADHRLRWLGVADRVRILDSNLLELSSLILSLQDVQPDEIYNLPA